MRRHRFFAVTHPFADHNRGYQTGDTRVNVYHGAAGIVEYAVFSHKAAAPYPMRGRYVNQHHPQAGKQHHGGKLHALGDGAGDDGGGNHGKSHLEYHENGFRNAAGIGCHRYHFFAHVQAHTVEEETVQTADKGVARCKGQRIAAYHP